MIKEEFLKLCEKHHLIGSNFVIANASEILESASFGLMDKEENIPYSDETITRIASISKTVLAIGLMQLQEKGLVDLKEDISKYLGYYVRNPYFPKDKITLEMITTQTSSIQDGYDDENPKYDEVIKGYNGINSHSSIDVTLKDLLTNSSSEYYTIHTFGKYKPGTRWCYSNFGCGIMACIIEKVSGMYYVDYMEENVFKPLGIVASYKSSLLPQGLPIATMYSGTCEHEHIYKKENFINSPLKKYELGNNFRGPAGGLFITMKDLAKIMQVFLNYGTLNGVQILKRETVELMYQMHWCGSPIGDSYKAKGIQMQILNNHPGYPLRGHTGGAYGVRSYMFFDLRQGLGGCFITNGIASTNESDECQAMFNESINLFLNEYAHQVSTKAIIREQEIELKERKIIDNELFIGHHIKAMHFADALNTVGEYKEDDMEFILPFKHKTLVIKDLVIFNDIPYIDLEKVLNDLELEFEVFKDHITILFDTELDNNLIIEN